MINVGSVGQPRDGDPRACYVILDDGPSIDVNAGEREDECPSARRESRIAACPTISSRRSAKSTT